MIGAPIAWAELWQVLKTHARDRGGQTPGPADGDNTTPVAVAAPKHKELPLHNGVTGANLPRAQRRAAAMRQAESEGTDALEETLPADDIEDKKLYFIETADGVGEGEFKVGIARVQGAARANGAIPVAWFTRKYTKSAAWGNGLALVPWMAPALAGQRIRRVGTSDEEPAHFLPVAVELTPKSVAPVGASIAGSSVRLTKRCVERLRAFLVRRRPELVVSTGALAVDVGAQSEATATAAQSAAAGQQCRPKRKRLSHKADSSTEEESCASEQEGEDESTAEGDGEECGESDGDGSGSASRDADGEDDDGDSCDED